MASSPAFPCPQCGARDFRRYPVDATRRALAHLALCASCGENYLAVVHHDADRGRVETWAFGLDHEPALRRVFGYAPCKSMGEARRTARLFFIGNRAVPESTWRAALAVRRALPSRAVLGGPAADRLPMSVVALYQAWRHRQAHRGSVAEMHAARPPSDSRST